MNQVEFPHANCMELVMGWPASMGLLEGWYQLGHESFPERHFQCWKPSSTTTCDIYYKKLHVQLYIICSNLDQSHEGYGAINCSTGGKSLPLCLVAFASAFGDTHQGNDPWGEPSNEYSWVPASFYKKKYKYITLPQELYRVCCILYTSILLGIHPIYNLILIVSYSNFQKMCSRSKSPPRRSTTVMPVWKEPPPRKP